jgi:transposase InsO family protein
VNQIWSWDITRLKGPVPHKHFYLYVIIDIFSRAVVGWLVAETECALIAKLLIQETMARFGITPFSGLVLHSDRGPQMTSKEVGQLLADLGVLKSFSRPRTSNDNPFSEAQFKTLKYSATYPDKFGSLQHARAWCLEFMNWYNQEHKHSGIGYYTPSSVQDGSYKTQQTQRYETLSSAAARFPERFNKQPVAPELPKAVWINPPISKSSLGVSEML